MMTNSQPKENTLMPEPELLEFLRARLDEDEQAARAVLGVNRMAAWRRGQPVPGWEYQEDGSIWDADGEGEQPAVRVKFTWKREAEHIVRHAPARVLAEVSSKQRILAECGHMIRRGEPERAGAEWILQVLALPFADHPDYRPEWSPDTPVT